MKTILIIDPDFILRVALRQALPANWSLCEADSGLRGLDLARQHLPHLDGIVVNLDMQDLGGLLVCALLRRMSATVRILPITHTVEPIPLLVELACAPPIITPFQRADLIARLHTAIDEPARTFVPSAAIAFLQTHAAETEQCIRQERASLRIVVFATSVIRRVGIERLVSGGALVRAAAHERELVHLLGSTRATVIVADAAEQRVAVAVAQQFSVPLILIARSSAQARAVARSPVWAVVRETHPHALQHLHELVATSAEKQHAAPASEPPSKRPDEPPIPPAIRHCFAQAQLSVQQQRVMWLDYHGWSASDIAQLFIVDRDTVETYWKRAGQKVGCARDDLRAWVRAVIQDAEERDDRAHEHGA